MLIDLSHTVEHGLETYRGLPAPTICDFLSREASRAVYAPGTEFQIGRIDMVANTGTYVDSPFHRFAEGPTSPSSPWSSSPIWTRSWCAPGEADGPSAARRSTTWR